jgi:hypothetical protein
MCIHGVINRPLHRSRDIIKIELRLAVMRGVNGASCARGRGPVMHMADVVTAVTSPRLLAVGQVGCVNTISEPTDSNVCQIK